MASLPTETPGRWMPPPSGASAAAGAVPAPPDAKLSPLPTEDELPRRGVAQLAQAGIGNSYEGLDDDDWEDHPFVPPSLPLAVETAEEDVFGGKELSACCTDIDTISGLGVGIGIWFRFLYISCAFFLLATLLSVPSFLVAAQGRRIAESTTLRTQDAFGFSMVSAGNVGPSLNDVAAANCTSGCRLVTPIIPDVNLDLADATLVLVASDAAVWVCLVMFLLVFFRTIRYVEDQIADNNLETASYSVMVTGLPKDATLEEVRAHFDGLYNLREQDWVFKGWCCGCCMAKYPSQRRPTFAKPKKGKAGEFRAAKDSDGVVVAPVLNATNTGDPAYLRSWVAEVTLAHPNGALIQQYRAMRHKLERLQRLRAAVKLYSEGSPYADARKRARAEAVLRGAEQAKTNTDAKLTRKFREDVVAAFVVFNTEESRRRALFDYAWSRNACLRCCQPRPLRFKRKGRPGAVAIKVEEAPDPADVLWENLEASSAERCCRQALSTTAMLFIVAVSLIFLVLAQQSSKLVEGSTPSFAVCAAEALRVAAGPGADVSSLRIVRDASLDSTCPGGGKGLFVADVSNPASPVPAPLISGLDPLNCTSKCVVPDAQAPTCGGAGFGERNFSKSDLIPCFCLDTLTRAQQNGVLLSALADLASEELCVNFATTTLARNSFVAIASIAVVVVNVVLRLVAHSLTQFERHVSVGSLQSAKVVKVLGLTFLNTAVITALVNVKFDTSGVPDWLAQLLGDVEGFEPRWFAVAGSSIVLTMALNVVTLNIGVLARVPCLLCECCCSRRSRVAPSSGEHRDSIAEMVAAPGPLELPEGELTAEELAEARKRADAVRIAQSSVSACDRCCARTCGCCGPQQACGCLVPVCSAIPGPLRCWCCCRGARARAAVTQAELTEMVDLSPYDIAQRWPLALNTFFVTVTYGSGMPALYPIAAVAFIVAFYVEKVALLRFTKQPPIMDAALARLSLRLLPIAVVLHLVVAILVFGDPALLESRSVFALVGGLDEGQTVQAWYQQQLNAAGDVATIASRIERESVVIPAVLLALFLLGSAVRALCSRSCRSSCRGCITVMCCGRPCVDTRQAVEYRKNPPFTGLYTQPLPRGVKHTLGELERSEGWRIQRDPNVRGDRSAQRKIKVWTASGEFNGKPHRKGERMLTWETIADVGLASYNPTANPEYAAAFLALESAVDKTREMARRRERELAMRAAILEAQMASPDGAAAAAGRGFDDGEAADAAGYGGDEEEGEYYEDGYDEDGYEGYEEEYNEAPGAWDIPDEASEASAEKHSASRRPSGASGAE